MATRDSADEDPGSQHFDVSPSPIETFKDKEAIKVKDDLDNILDSCGAVMVEEKHPHCNVSQAGQ